MKPSDWFDDVPVLGRWMPDRAATKLRELGDEEGAAALERGAPVSRTGPAAFGVRDLFGDLFGPKLWKHTAHTFGYVPPAASGAREVPLQHAGSIAADASLKNARIKVTLDCLRVADYPGTGTHHVLFDFYAQNQVPNSVEHLHFNAAFRVREGEQAALVGYPLFVGLNVGAEGVALKCFTVNVKNDDDEALLSFLDSDAFKSGLKLAAIAQPAVAQLSQVALVLTKTLAGRHRNVPVQEFFMGLDFSGVLTRARLAEGSYVAVQIPAAMQATWAWNEWVYTPDNGQLVHRQDPSRLIPYNYVVFSVSRYQE